MNIKRLSLINFLLEISKNDKEFMFSKRSSIKDGFLRQHSLMMTGLFVVLLSGNITELAANEDPVQELVQTKAVTKALQFSSVFQGRGDGISTCPVTGEKITAKKLQAELFGRTVYFCCHGCLKTAKKNPEKFVKATQEEQQNAVKAYLAKAVQTTDEAEFCNE